MDNKIISTIGITEPVTLLEVKNYLRITNSRDDDFINSIIPNARIRAERYLNSDIVSKQRREYFDNICEAINLRYAPITQVDSVLIDGETMAYNLVPIIRNLHLGRAASESGFDVRKFR